MTTKEMTPEELHTFHMNEWTEEAVKSAKCMARCRFTVFKDATPFDFKIYLSIDHDDDWEYYEVLKECKKMVEDGVELNTTSYKGMADQLYRTIAKEMPGREIWIVINTNNIGVTTKYNQKYK